MNRGNGVDLVNGKGEKKQLTLHWVQTESGQDGNK